MIPIKLENLYTELIECFVVERIDAERYVKNILESYGYQIEKGLDVGHPDFKVLKAGKIIFYVEVKTNGDGLRKEQMEWILSHPKDKVLLIFIDQKTEKKEKKKIIREREKRVMEEEELKKIAREANRLI